ncbi:MAG: Gfo/Idh/MocA family protein [Actinomycetota bacterium]
MSDPGVVVVGTGFGARVHVPALRAAGLTVNALVGRDAERTHRRAERLGVPTAFTSLDEALAHPGVAAVTIATPPNSHCELAVTAVGAGKHVICEKPFALDADEAEAMLRAADAAGVTHLVGHEFRWATDRAVAGRAIAEGAIGEPRLASFVQWLPLVADPETKMPAWWFDRGAGGGWLGASGSHVVDQVRAWLGEIATVNAALPLASDRPAGAAEDSFVVRLGLASGAEAVLQQTAGAWGPSVGVTRVAGTRGTVWLEDGAAWVADASGTRPLPVPADLQLPPPPVISDDARHRFTHLELGPYTRLCEALRAGVARRPLPTAVPLPTFVDGVGCMRVLDAIRASAAGGGETVRP